MRRTRQGNGMLWIGLLLGALGVAALVSTVKVVGLLSSRGGTASEAFQKGGQTVKGDVLVAPISIRDHVRGENNAPVAIIEYSDFECPYCKEVHPLLKEILETYKGEVKWVYRHFPLPNHSFAQAAAEASECAGEQGKFWEYADTLFATQSLFSDDYFLSLALKMGIDRANFEDCMSKGRYRWKVEQERIQAITAGATGTPFSIVLFQGQSLPISGAFSRESITQMLDSILGK